MLWTLIVLLIVGLVAGAIARAIMPGPDNMGLPATLLLGLAGSFVGGFLGYVILGNDRDSGAFQPAGLLGSVIGALIVLGFARLASGPGEV